MFASDYKSEMKMSNKISFQEKRKQTSIPYILAIPIYNHNIIIIMKLFLLACLIGLAVAAPQQPRDQPEVTLLRSESDNKGDGTFHWNFETSDGTRQEQRGYIKNPEEPEPDNRIQVIEGSYSHTSPEGNPISITYVADENGYQPQGDAIPTSPPIPEAILKVLEIINNNAAQQVARAKKAAKY